MRLGTFTIALTVFVLAMPVRAGDMKKELDFAAKFKMMETHFKDYGQPASIKTIYFEENALRFWLEAATKDAKQSGLYSHFTLTGDFEITIVYEWFTVNTPKEGYGVSCGVAVESEGKTVALARGFQIGAGDAYIITTKIPGKAYETKTEPTQAKKGRMVLRRQKAAVVCLRAEGDETLEEIAKIPFTSASVRKVRFFADPGDKPNQLDARLSEIRIRAEQILTDIPESERTSTLGWWLTVGGIVIGAIGGYVGYRRWRDDKWLWSREE